MIKRYLFTGILTVIIAMATTSCSSEQQEENSKQESTQSIQTIKHVVPTVQLSNYTFDESNMFSQKLNRVISNDEYSTLQKYVFQETYLNNITVFDAQCSIAAVILNVSLNDPYYHTDNLVELIASPIFSTPKAPEEYPPTENYDEYLNSSINAVNAALGGYDPTSCIGGADHYSYGYTGETSQKILYGCSKEYFSMDLSMDAQPAYDVTFFHCY